LTNKTFTRNPKIDGDESHLSDNLQSLCQLAGAYVKCRGNAGLLDRRPPASVTLVTMLLTMCRDAYPQKVSESDEMRQS
jgi:hypothetical protein